MPAFGLGLVQPDISVSVNWIQRICQSKKFNDVLEAVRNRVETRLLQSLV